MPHGGDGVFHFSAYLLVEQGQTAVFDMMLNDEQICSAFPNHNSSGAGDVVPASCSAVISVVADNVHV